jgi:quercetin dioxygenase-like cupin family protein
MPFVDTNSLKLVERLPGWKGRYFHSATMTFAHYEFAAGSSIHEHFHPEEEGYEVIEGELEVTIDGKSQIAKPGMVAIVSANSRHLHRSTKSRTPNNCGPSIPSGLSATWL